MKSMSDSVRSASLRFQVIFCVLGVGSVCLWSNSFLKDDNVVLSREVAPSPCPSHFDHVSPVLCPPQTLVETEMTLLYESASRKAMQKFGMEPMPDIPPQYFVRPRNEYGTNLVQEGLKALLDTTLSLEFGPLVSPTLSPNHPNTRYIDHLDREALTKKYANDPGIAPKLDSLPNIDFVWDGRNLSELVGGVEKFGLVVANHVIEHVPDVVTWLRKRYFCNSH